MNIYSSTMFSKLIILLLVIGIDVTIGQSDILDCKPPPDFIRPLQSTGTFRITRNVESCGFKSIDDSELIAINTDNLIVKEGDTWGFKVESQNLTEINPPIESGWILYGLREPDIVFNFKDKDSTSMLVNFVQNTTNLTINGDISREFVLRPISVKSINLVITKTVEDLIHLEVDSSHRLLSESVNNINVGFDGDKVVRVKLSMASKDCSKAYDDKPSDVDHNLAGPDVDKLSQGYKCVNIFQVTDSNKNPLAHYEANFKDFLGLTDELDELTINDQKTDVVKVSRPRDISLTGQSMVFKGEKLVVVYNSPRKVKPSKIQFKLTISLRNVGGLLENEGKLIFGGANRTSYSLRPAAGQFVLLKINPNTNVTENSIEIATATKIIAKFPQNTRLPPFIASEEPSVDMNIIFSGTGLSKLTNMFSFVSVAEHCHRIINEKGSTFSIVGPHNGSCYLSIVSDDPVDLKIHHNDLMNDGCLSISTQLQDQPIFKRCNISHSEILPTLTLTQSFLNVTLTKGGRLDASIVQTAIKPVMLLNPLRQFNFTSPGYPIDYPWSAAKQTYSLRGSKANYVFSVTDIDIRKGEKFLLDNIELNPNNLLTTGDVIRTNQTTNITIVRSITDDFKLHRGYKIVVEQYDEVIVADKSKGQIKTSSNSTALLIKISFPSTVKDSFGQRISYNFTINNNSTDYILSGFDGRSIQKNQITSITSKGNTTSDTLFLTFKAIKPNTKLPVLTVDYQTIVCNSTQGDFICDSNTRCVPKNLLCQSPRKFFCQDGSDVMVECNSDGPIPQPQIIQKGVGGFAVFILCILMLLLGALGALYGPNLFRNLESRFRSGQYSTFTSVE